MSAETDKIRRDFKASDDRRDAGLTTPEGIRRFDNIPYGPDGMEILDVYRPRAAGAAPLPVIVSVHGGGWVYGTKETYQFYCMDLALRGFAVVNFTYRLAPEAKFPASLEDTVLVFRWVLDNAERYGFDPRHVFAVGDSAGGHILTLFCQLCTNPAYARRYAFSPPDGFAPRAVALNCGAYHHARPKGAPTAGLMGEVLPGGGTQAEFALVDALRYVTGDFPPTFLMTSTGDFLQEDALLMARRLTRACVPFELHLYGDSVERLGHVFHCDVKTQAAKICNDDECAFFRRFIGN